MTLIKLYYTNQVQHLARQVQEKLPPSSSNHSIQEALLYGKFQALADKLRPLLSQVEKRFLYDRDQYGALLAEFFAVWVAARSQLLHPRIKLEITRIQIAHHQVPDLISLATTSCNYMRALCTAEWNLFKSCFPNTGEDELFVYLESLCDYLYDLLRPQILHEQKIDLLCDLATISNALIAMDSSLIEADQSRFKFSTLLKPILQDVQTRLVFRAQTVIQADVARYTPRAADLDYPHMLVRADQTRRQQKKPTRSSPHARLDHPHAPLRSRLPAEEVQETWYPPLRKTLWVLSRLHTYVNDAIFEDFAGEAVGICSESILQASTMIPGVGGAQASTQIQATMLDRELFVIRHLLILKQMIRTLDVVQVERAVDLGPLTDVLREILNPSFRHSLLFRPLSLIHRLKTLTHSPLEFSKRIRSHHAAATLPLDFEGIEGQVTKTIDGKSDLDSKLKTVCQRLIATSCGLICAHSLEPFMTQCQNYLNLQPTPPSSSAATRDNTLSRKLGTQEWASQAAVQAVVQSFVADLGRGLAVFFGRLALYFHADDMLDADLVNVLFPALQEEIMDVYRRFFSLITFELDIALVGPEDPTDNDGRVASEDALVGLAQGRVLAPEEVHTLIQKIVYRLSADSL